MNVEESSLRAHVRTLRKTLGDHPSEAEYVTNVPGRGYCFVAPVERLDRIGSQGAQPDATSNLPGRAAAIIGRSDSIAVVRRELSQSRLVTIAGPAGVGKTTVAIAAAQAIRDEAGGSVCFVDLAPVQAPSLVISALATALGRPRQRNRSTPGSRSVLAG